MEKSIQEKYIEALETIIQLKAHIDLINIKVLNYMSDNKEAQKEVKADLKVLQFPEKPKSE